MWTIWSLTKRLMILKRPDPTIYHGLMTKNRPTHITRQHLLNCRIQCPEMVAIITSVMPAITIQIQIKCIRLHRQRVRRHRHCHHRCCLLCIKRRQHHRQQPAIYQTMLIRLIIIQAQIDIGLGFRIQLTKGEKFHENSNRNSFIQ